MAPPQKSTAGPKLSGCLQAIMAKMASQIHPIQLKLPAPTGSRQGGF